MISVAILGCGVPTPTSERFGSSYLLHIGGDRVLIDCGPATTFRLAQLGLLPTAVGVLFFTHHHFDHNADYPCFVLCRWDQSRESAAPLTVYGPPPTAELTRALFDASAGAYSHDWRARVDAPTSQAVFENRGGRLPRPPLAILATDIEAGFSHDGGSWRVTTAEAIHVQPYLESIAYRFDSDEGSVVFTGDTEACESVRRLAEAADVMVCMCWDRQQTMEAEREDRGQCGTTGAAKLARDAGVGKLVLSHLGARICRPDVRRVAIAEVKAIYAGDVVFAEELMAVGV